MADRRATQERKGAKSARRLTRRREFVLAASRGQKAVRPGLVMQLRQRNPEREPENVGAGVRLGFTASKKVGNAVRRNRARRRLRSLAAERVLTRLCADVDVVFVARAATVERPYADLVRDVDACLRRLYPALDKPLAEALPANDSAHFGTAEVANESTGILP